MKPCYVSWCCALPVEGHSACIVHLKYPKHKKPDVKRELEQRFEEAMKQ